jgi:hypothetical protein
LAASVRSVESRLDVGPELVHIEVRARLLRIQLCVPEHDVRREPVSFTPLHDLFGEHIPYNIVRGMLRTADIADSKTVGVVTSHM